MTSSHNTSQRVWACVSDVNDTYQLMSNGVTDLRLYFLIDSKDSNT